MRARGRTILSVLALTVAVGACSDDLVDTPTAQEGRWGDRIPAQVTDLEVVSTTSSSAVLGFTQVPDGRDRPANYEVRFQPAPLGQAWNDAPVVSAGTCASPVQGSEIGVRLECSVEGLDPGTTYDFQLVAFSGGLNKNTVFGPLSNTATGTTAAPDTAGIPTDTTSVPGDTTSVPGDSTSVPGDTASTPDTATWTDPGTVTDLVVKSAGSGSVVLRFTQVHDGAGAPAAYDVRYAVSPIGWGWGSATVVTRGTCSSPAEGSAVGAPLECTVEGLTNGQKYDFQLIAFRGVLGSATYGGLSNVATGTPTAPTPGDGSTGDGSTGGAGAGECDSASSAWIWCDDFERDRMASYFEHDDAGGAFTRTSGVGVGGSAGMRARWAAGQVSVGSLKLAFGRTPSSTFRAVDGGSRDYREIYWRVYVKNEPTWTGGGGYKLSRSTVFTSSSWTQAMIAHVWSGSSTSTQSYLINDPVRGTDASGNVVTTKYNDFANFTWLGATNGIAPLYDSANVGQWHCVEARVRLNDAGASNGVFEIWVDGKLDSRRTDLNWLGSYADYGLNAVFLENYWNGGSPKAQERYLDNFVVSTQRIGC